MTSFFSLILSPFFSFLFCCASMIDEAHDDDGVLWIDESALLVDELGFMINRPQKRSR